MINIKKIKFWIFKNIFRYKYIINFNSKEIHSIKSYNNNCKVLLIKDYKFIRLIDIYIQKGYNGCGNCNKKYHII